MSDPDSQSTSTTRAGKVSDVANYLETIVKLAWNLGIIIFGFVIIVLIVFYGRYDLINQYVPNLIRENNILIHEKSPETIQRGQSTPMSTEALRLRPVYLDLETSSAANAMKLKQQLGDSGIQVTDDPTRSGVTLHVAINVSEQTGISVGSIQTWRADAMLSMEAFGTQDHSRLFGRTYHGQEKATLLEAARERAVDGAISQFVNDYRNQVQARSN